MQGRGAFTIREFCDWSRLGRTKTYELIGDGSLPIVKVGNKTLIRVEDATALFEQNLQKYAAGKGPATNAEAA